MMTWWLVRFQSHIRRTCGDLIEGDQELKGFSLEHYEVHNIHASGTFAPLFVSQLTWCTRLIQILLLLSVLMQASILPTMQDAMKVGDMFQLFLFTTQPLQSNHQTCMRRAPSAFFCSFLHYPTLLLYGCSNVVHSKWGVWWTLGEKLFGRRVIYSPWIIANLRGHLHSTWFDIIRWIVPCMALLYARLIWPHLGRLQVLCWSWRVPGALQLGWSQKLKCRRNGTESGYDIPIYILYIDILDLDFDCIVL